MLVYLGGAWPINSPSIQGLRGDKVNWREVHFVVGGYWMGIIGVICGPAMEQ